ncbi:interleukin-15 receptor subunit alpha isoform X1 [Heterocephalus glaber]|uniref:Interleukin-15 receptor subunit alpha n=2 Tax=Heterocephalus glaber TaxID=10181 RepID=A0AAX6R047_HETGA|nr:interleukin-15 receptor subunit alpha isoform X1 [Heterocephalus glaber]
MLSHGSVTASHLSPALRGLKQKRKRMRQAGGRSQSCASHLPRPGHCTRGRPRARWRDTAGRTAMVPRQLRGCRVHALAALLLQLLLLPPVTLGATCPSPTSVEHADIRVKSYNLHSRERYVCNSGFKRKAGTSSLTECVFNKTTNITHWTTPNLKCIKPAALSPKSDTTLATETATVPGPWLMSSKPPSVGTTGIGSHEPSQTPSQKTAVTLEHTPSTSKETPGAHPDSSRYATVIIATSVPGSSLVVCLVSMLACYIKSRNTSQPRAVEMETMEAKPMTGGTSSREDDTGNDPLNL